MGYKPIYDYTCDLVPFDSAEEFTEFLASIYERKLVLLGYRPIGDSVEIKVRGTRDQLVSWFREYYAVGAQLDVLNEKDVMHWADDNGELVCIA